MDEPSTSPRLVRRRMRRVAGKLTEDSSLRDNLSDDQAQQLLDWGLRAVEETAVQTAELSEEDAAPILEEKVTAVRRVMKMANELMGSLDQPVDEVIDDQMIRLLKNLRWLTGEPLTRTQEQEWAAFNQFRPGVYRESAFPHLMALIRGDTPHDDHEGVE